MVSFDYGLLGIGGLPNRNFIEIYGMDKVGKSTLLQHIMAAYQREGYVIAVIDQKADIASDLERACSIGVDPDRVVVLPLQTTEESIEGMKQTLVTFKDKRIKCALFWDDVGLSPSEKSLSGASDMGAKAKLSWDFCRALQPSCYRYEVPMIIVNQLMDNIGGFGKKTMGGGSYRYASRIRIKLSKKYKDGVLKKNNVEYGHIVEAKTEANVFFNPKRTVYLSLIFDSGYDNFSSLFENMLYKKLIKKKPRTSRYECLRDFAIYSKEDIVSKDELFKNVSDLEIAKEVWPEVFGKEALTNDFEDVVLEDSDWEDLE